MILSPMTRSRSILDALHRGTLGLWMGVLLMVGTTAAIAFPTMKSLDPHLPAYARYDGDHWAIAAGAIMNRAFLVSEWATAAFGAVAMMTLGFARRRRGRVWFIRLLALTVALGLSIWILAGQRPAMSHHLESFWSAAAAGDNAMAAEHKAAFDRMHPVASNLLITQLVLAGLAFAGSCVRPSEESA
jgi:small-conductance mechanosensitive channel